MAGTFRTTNCWSSHVPGSFAPLLLFSAPLASTYAGQRPAISVAVRSTQHTLLLEPRPSLLLPRILEIRHLLELDVVELAVHFCTRLI